MKWRRFLVKEKRRFVFRVAEKALRKTRPSLAFWLKNKSGTAAAARSLNALVVQK